MKRTKLIFAIATLLFSFILTFNNYAQFGLNKPVVQGNVFLSSDAAYPGGTVKIALKLKIDDKWHINSIKPNEPDLLASKLVVNKPFEIIEKKFPVAKNLKFSFSEVPVSVYQGNITIGAIVKIPDSISVGEQNIKISLNYQACNNLSCLPPNSFLRELKINVVPKGTKIPQKNSQIFEELNLGEQTPVINNNNNSQNSSIGKTLSSSGLLVSIIFVFLGGLALNLTPCVYPLIPITIGYFGGQAGGSTKHLAFLGVLYVLGIALTYSVVGVVTSLSGAVFGALLQNPIVILFIVAVFIALGLSQFEVYEFKLPDSWVMKAGGAKSGGFGAFFMGLTMGIVAAPCIGPFVIGLVTYVAAKGDPFYGFLMFFFLALGLGFPYLILAIFSGKIKSLPKAGDWMRGVEHIFGLILFAAAVYFLAPLLPRNVQHYLLPVFAIISAIYLLFIDKTANKIKTFFTIKIIFSLLILGASLYALWPTQKGEIPWKKYSLAQYEASLKNHRKVIIDFYADWCIPCKELDAQTFSDPEVIKAAETFDNYKVDMTESLSEATEKVRKKFNIKGMPTVIIFNSSGKEVERITGFIPPEEFLKIILKIK